ncbi:MAG TPA: hydantoinase B/oxoprolinase family protein [Fibrobacteria bacterium]|nr:hydantoinase B/oxoprolinase family protein [Fibrobacteria bacterium]
MDQGGTFTDCIGLSPEGGIHVAKVLSGPLAPPACIRKILQLREEEAVPPAEIRLGTTLATNALLERRGHPHALLVTEGFADALEIGTQQRPDLFALDIRKPGVLYSHVAEAAGRLGPDGAEIRPLDADRLGRDLSRLRARGAEGLAIVLLHGYAFPAHEKAAAECARKAGFTRVSCSHEVNPEIGLTARGDTTTVDAYLTPLLADYLETLRAHLPGCSLRLMQSNGGLTDPERFRGHNAILSGPAGGAVACARLAERAGYPKAIGFDMGGTSTDVSRYAGGDFEKVYEWTAAGLRIRSPSLDIHTVAAGGGSLCRLHSGRLTVGPESAGSDPGPVCYGRRTGGDLTITDVNLFLGRLLQDNFPFPLRAGRVAERMEALRARLQAEGQDLTAREIAGGFLEIVNRQMAQAVKDVSLARGHEASDHVLICFGGAGGQHACAVARLLGIRRILLHPLGGVLSALGMGLAAARWEGSAPVARLPLGPESLAALEPGFAALEESGRANLRAQGYTGVTVAFRRRLDLRYLGTEHALSVPRPADGDWGAAFRERHRLLYGYVRPDRGVEILQLRVEATEAADAPWPELRQPGGGALPEPLRMVDMVSPGGSSARVPVYRRETIPAGLFVEGPALILDQVATLVLEEDFRALMDGEGRLVLEMKAAVPEDAEAAANAAPGGATGQGTLRNGAPGPGIRRDVAGGPVLLELFNHAFMAVAEHMGKVLQRTALSTNIKERLDFSCAVFDAAGHLVANAPHIPVHLGAMGESVRHILRAWPRPAAGDVFATNNPYRGGSHLPDITVVTPVFLPARPDGAGAEAIPVFFTASRAHHADVGGITPGSMPAFSTRLEEEGILLDAVKMVDRDRFRADAITARFTSGPWPARNPGDNIADLQAQAAANLAGARMLHDLVAEHGLDKVRDQMERLRANAARQVREALGRLSAKVREGAAGGGRDGMPDGNGGNVYEFADALDDGTPIRVRITLEAGGAVVDFTGSGKESQGNLNAPPAVVRSAVMYVLRCLVAERIPVNEGCLDPVRIVLPEASILNPSPGRAVVGGNVETSQRVVDCLLGALGLAAASQGTMNNVTFGDDSFGYYETLAGGAGAGPGFHGASAVHTHMTNTRITDPEVLETRYPVRLERFSVRRGTGGNGRWNGGDGLVRHYRFLSDVQVSLMTERRETAPFGLEGGEPGARGRNRRVTPQGGKIPLAHAVSYEAHAGEGLIIETPGGGGFGGA